MKGINNVKSHDKTGMKSFRFNARTPFMMAINFYIILVLTILMQYERFAVIERT